jgi:glycosyltransferase involved in cell wall biosynthesis
MESAKRLQTRFDMKILYEGAIFQILRCGGVARYITELIGHLPDHCAPTVLGTSVEASRLSHPNLNFYGARTEPPVAWLRKWTRDRMQRQIADVFDSIDADLEHWTYYSGLCRRPIRRGHRPLVVTVLDFVHEAFPSLDPAGRHIAMKHEAIRVADHLICISHSTHDELCERFPWARHKASVIPLGTSLARVAAESLPESLAGKPYVLFVGRRNNYKNFEVVWKAWNRIRRQLPKGSKLAIVGPPMKRREAVALNWRDDGSAVLIPNASDGMLRTLYEHSRGFLFPSRAEGFGLPSLEAMSAGTPVMASDLPVMREVIGDSGYYFDPDDVDTVAEMIEAALTGQLPDADSIVEQARRRSAAFTWQATAEQTATVYKELTAHLDPPREEILCAV